MKTVKFQDMQNNEILIQASSGDGYRIYYNALVESSPCLLLNEHQAKILIAALLDLMEYRRENG